MKKNLLQTLLASGLAALMLSGTSHSEEVRIAIAGPVTGDVAQYGDMQVTGAEMAVERLNKDGKGPDLKSQVFDDACDPKQAVAVARRIVNEGYQFVVGHLCSSSTQAASDIYEDEGVLLITPASTSPDITQRGLKMVFRTIGLDSLQGPTAARYIARRVKPSKVAIIHDKQQYGEGIATAVRDTLKEEGINVAMFEGISKGDKDFSALIAKMQKAGIDFVYYGGYHPELGLILRQSADKGLKAQFMGPEGVGNADISAIAGEASEGLLVTLPPAFDKRAENRDLAEAFQKAGKDASGAFVMTSYAAVQIISDAVEKAGTTDTAKLADFLRKNTFDTPMGKVAYDEKGDLKEFDFEIYNWHKDGTKTAVK